MCFFSRSKIVEEIIAENSVGMSDAERSQYWYELSQNIFELLGKIDVPLVDIGGWTSWKTVAQAQYPTLTEVKIPDSKYQTTTLEALHDILVRDWTNKVPYLADIFDCDKFANLLYNHLCQYYKLNAIFPVWGQTTSGYHGFNLAVVQENGILIARLVEPQTDSIFVSDGPLGNYQPQRTAEFLGVMKIGSPA